MSKGYEKTINIVPSARQIKWQNVEYYGIIYYGMNTFTGDQWGDGFAPASLFWPEKLVCDDWVSLAKTAGMNGLVLTAKHYDGFCLWPTKMTDYSVASCTNWQDGKGDVVKELAEACRRGGIKFGLYVSPWDRHEKSYGTGKDYDDFFCGLLEELLSDYGDIFCLWLDPVCGNGINGTVQNFDLARYYEVVRRLQPDCAIVGLGPDGRWCGNDKGVTRKGEWSVVPAYLGTDDNATDFKCKSSKKLSLTSPDLGSRKTIDKEDEFVWYPLEVSVPLRNRWFWNKDNEYSVKTKDKLLPLYFNTVGNNSNLMIGLAPDKRGEFLDTEMQILTAFGKDLRLNFGYNLIEKKGSVSVSSEYAPDCSKDKMSDGRAATFWRPADSDKCPEITVSFSEKDLFDKIVICENIANGQHIEEFEVYYKNEKGKWKLGFEGTAVGRKRICYIPPVSSDGVKIIFKKYRGFFEITDLLIN